MLKDIEKFHEKFGFEKRQGIQNNKDLVDFRIKFLEEELNEFKEAIKEKNDAKALLTLLLEQRIYSITLSIMRGKKYRKQIWQK